MQKTVLNKQALDQALLIHENGAIFAISQKWASAEPGALGHSYVAEKINGKIVYMCPQQNIVNYNGPDRAKDNTIRFFRIDKISFKDDFDYSNIVEEVK